MILAFVSMLILKVSGSASAWAFICQTFSEIASVSDVFLDLGFSHSPQSVIMANQDVGNRAHGWQ
jgi:hypothetical protein